MRLFAPQVTHARMPFLITLLGEVRGDQPLEHFKRTHVDLWHNRWISLNSQEHLYTTSSVYDCVFFFPIFVPNCS